MFSEDTLEARQNNEFEALQAIYGEQLRDLRQKRAWNKWCPLNLSITLTPQRGNSGCAEVYAKVDLHIVCSERYPNEVPQLTFKNSKGLSQSSLEQLKNQLLEKALEYKGEEMIFQLCQYVEEFLHHHNKPAMVSFYDEMLRQQEERKKEAELQKQLEADRQKETMMKEVQQRQEMLKAEAKLRRERHRSLSENEPEEEFVNNNRRTSFSTRKHHNSDHNEDSSCEHKGTLVLDFGGRSVQRGQCLRHGESSSVVFTGIDTESGEMVEVVQWSFEAKKNDNGQLIKNVSSIEQELNYLAKLKHVNLAQYLGFKHDIVDDSKVVVYVLKELVLGSNCHSLFTGRGQKADIDFLKYLGKGVLKAIDYIHRNYAVHKDLKDTCVFINEKGIVKVSDYSIQKRLLDLINSAHGNYNKKTDIYDFGKLVLRLLGYSTLPEEQIPSELPSDLYDLLSNCLNKDERERYTANQLLNHSFFHEPLVHYSPQHLNRHIPPVERGPSPEIPSLLKAGDGQSRITNEFQFLVKLGQGAFGDVVKVKNKLDSCYYAIKRILLLPHNKALNKRKIVREVTTLSKLNHENIVRYYNSWIETATTKIGDSELDSSVTTATTTTTEPSKKPQNVLKVLRKEEFTMNDDIEKMAPPIENVEISITYDGKSQAPFDESSEDDDDDSSDDDFGAPGGNQYDGDSDSDGIEFERGESYEEDESTSKEGKSAEDRSKSVVAESPKEMVRQVDYLYIQMEFCEKSTLRTAIDNHLYQDEERVWRLFREIVEGLAYIHLQGIIHRDLKPVNIFLDSKDHVKIGDFGLATSIGIRTKQSDAAGISKSQMESLKDDLADESKTKQVGTPLYVAPEIDSIAKAYYNEKVDIYSLGIIFFEMCYQPLDTAMERSIILNKLRCKEIIFPEEFPENNERAYEIIKWLLNHDISKRPSAQELLQSKQMPPAVVEDQELQDLVRHTLNNTSSKGYRHLISSCFKQTITAAQDITYDREPTNSLAAKSLNVYEFVRELCVKIFKQHGAQNLATPLLMPKSRYYEDTESCVNLMTHFGNIVCLPHDLRVSFARYVAWNNVSSLRRYSVERVYKEKKVFGFLPREFYECAFDIVTPNKGYLMADAEILYVVYEIINELPGLKNKHFLIKLNHTSLFEAILLYCGVGDSQVDLLRLLQDIKEGKVPKSQLQNFLIQKGLSDGMMNFLTNCLHSEIEMSKAASYFQSITKKRSGDAGELAKCALQELKLIVQNAEFYGVQFEFVIAPGLVYNIKQYSGMICQFVCELKKKKRPDNKEVVAVGGRYDSMIAYYRGIMEQTNMVVKNVSQSAVGVSISLDRLVQGVQKEDKDALPKMDALDAIVCSIGAKQLIKEKTKILRSLWASGVKCSLIEAANTVEVQEQLMELGVSYAIILKDNDQGFVRMRSWEKDSRESFEKFQEKLYSTSELVENLQKILKIRNDTSSENVQSSNNLARSESKSSYTEKNDSEAVVDILLITQEKLSSNVRKRYENQARSQLDGLFKKLSGFTTVIAVSLDASAVRHLVSFLEFESETAFNKSVQNCVSKLPKLKQYLNEICEEIWEIRCKKTNPTVVLYSLTDNFSRVIM